MPDGGLTSGWGEIVAEALADVPPAPEDIRPFSEVVASGQSLLNARGFMPFNL